MTQWRKLYRRRSAREQQFVMSRNNCPDRLLGRRREFSVKERRRVSNMQLAFVWRGNCDKNVIPYPRNISTILYVAISQNILLEYVPYIFLLHSSIRSCVLEFQWYVDSAVVDMVGILKRSIPSRASVALERKGARGRFKHHFSPERIPILLHLTIIAWKATSMLLLIT